MDYRCNLSMTVCVKMILIVYMSSDLYFTSTFLPDEYNRYSFTITYYISLVN